MRATPGVIADECLTLAVEQPRLTEEMLRSPAFAHIDEQMQHLLFMGVDPQRAFGGSYRLDAPGMDGQAAAKKA